MNGKDIKAVVDNLNIQYERHMSEIKCIVSAVESLQDVCDHEFVYDWHDSHYSYESCKFCGKERKI